MPHSKKYNERLKRFNDAVACKTPDRVPVFPIIEQWANAYAGTSIRDSYTKNPFIELETFRKVYDDIYVDISYGTGNLIPLDMMKNFGEGIYVVSDQGVQIKGSHGRTMEDTEYPQLIADPTKFILDTIVPRKYATASDADKAIGTWTKGALGLIKWKLYEETAMQLIERVLDVPIVNRNATFLPPDIILDFLRDFAGASSDVRRHPEEFKAACEAMLPMSFRIIQETDPFKQGLVFMPLHFPTYLRPKDFENLYFPSMKGMAELLLKSGRRAMFYCENDWTPYIDIIKDLPGGGVYCLFEKGDLKEYKKALEGKVCVGGGMPVDLLKNGTRDECLNKAQQLLDDLAPGGGYIFALDMNLLSPNDVNPENLAAVTHYVHFNGKY